MNNKKLILYDKFIDDSIALNPTLNDALNLKKFDHLSAVMENSFSVAHESKELELYKKYLNKIATTNLTIADKFLKFICESSIEGYSYNFSLIPINPLENDLTYLAEDASGNGSYEFYNKKSYEDFLSRIKVLPEMCSSIIQKMREGIELKYTLPHIATKKMITQIDLLIKNKTFHNSKAPKSFSVQIDKLFTRELLQLNSFLRNEYLPKCRKSIGWCDLPNGKREYLYLVKNTITEKDISIKQIHEFGLLEVKRVEELMDGVMKQMEFKGTRREFFAYIRNRKDLKFKSKKHMLEEYTKMYKSIEKKVMPKLFSKKIKTECEILQVPEYNEKFSPEAYYIDGDATGANPGRFYINMRNINQNSKIEIESLTLHETIPGHHYQLSYLNESKTLPEFVKLFGVESYLEGWALYCENLGEYKTPESYFGKLVLEMIRSIRLVVDTGIHYYGWSFNKCFNFFKKHGFDTDEQINTQLIRYICLPSQALAYKMGEKCIIECLRKFHADGGNDIKVFHEKVLEDGAIPLYILREKFNLK